MIQKHTSGFNFLLHFGMEIEIASENSSQKVIRNKVSTPKILDRRRKSGEKLVVQFKRTSCRLTNEWVREDEEKCERNKHWKVPFIYDRSELVIPSHHPLLYSLVSEDEQEISLLEVDVHFEEKCSHEKNRIHYVNKQYKNPTGVSKIWTFRAIILSRLNW